MTEVTIPYHLALAALISLTAFVIILLKKETLFSTNKPKRIWISIMVFCVAYAIIVGGALLEDIRCQLLLNSFDLDKDGLISGLEQTNEQKEAFLRSANDVGRNFSFITGFLFSLILSAPVYWIVLFFEKVKESRKAK